MVHTLDSFPPFIPGGFLKTKKAPPDHFAARSPLSLSGLSAAVRGAAGFMAAPQLLPRTAAQSVPKILSQYSTGISKSQRSLFFVFTGVPDLKKTAFSNGNRLFQLFPPAASVFYAENAGAFCGK